MISSFHQRGADLFKLSPNHSLALLLQLGSIINSVTLSTEGDSISWTLSWTNASTVRSCYHVLNDGGLRSQFKSTIWKCIAPLKIKVFAWLVMKDKILTHANLLRK